MRRQSHNPRGAGAGRAERLDGARGAAAPFPAVQKSALRLVPLAALCAAVALAGGPCAAGAERKKEPLPEAPPPALPQAVKVPRGEPAEIALRIYGVKNEPLKYLIRTPPKSGKLTEPRVLEREVSAVTYTPPADLAVTRDRFSYAVQNGAGVSASVDVVITIVDQPPDLALSGALDFAPMLAGATAAKTVEIRNRGGGLAEGQVAVEAPWKIEGAARYRLAAGARAVFKVVFAPEKGGVFESAVRFSSQPESGVRVRGEAQEAIAAAPAKIELQNAAGDAVRTGTFELTNQTDAECRVTLSGGARLQVPAELTVPAHGKVSVPVQTAAADVTALEGEVRAEAAGLTVRVPVRAARVGPLVRSVRGPVMFGRVDAARAAGADFELENFGGTEAQVSWEIGAPFVMEQPSARLAPGEKKTLTLRTQPAAAAGKYRAWLAVQCERQKLEIPVEAELFAKAAPAAVPRTNAASRVASASPSEPEAAAPEVIAAEPIELPAIVKDLHAELFRPPGAGLTQLSVKSATLEWPAGLSAAANFRVEYRRVVADAAGEMKVVWNEVPKTVIRRAGEKFAATFGGMVPGESYGVRVVPLGPGGEAGPPLFTQFFVTPAGAEWLPQFTLIRGLMAVFAVCAGFMLRQRWLRNRRV